MASSALHSVAKKLAHPTGDAKSKKKKTGKTLEPPPAAASKDSSALNSPRNEPVDDLGDGSGENPHIREINKQIRNINKKLNSMSKLDAILAENPGQPLDELVAARKINADQKAQALKKPQLQQQLQALEAQLSVFRDMDDAYAKKSSKDKEQLLAAHADELDKVKAQARIEARAELNQMVKNKLLTFSRFLAAAATRRNMGDDSGDEARAFEGALLLVYGGDLTAVEAAEKIINGSSDKVMNIDGQLTNVSFARVRELSLEGAPAADWASPTDAASDPTLANASLTELDDPTITDMANGTARLAVSSSSQNNAPPAASSIDASAANAAADSQWDASKPDDPLAESYEMVPRDPAETGTPQQPPQQSWSDEVAAASEWADSSAAGTATTAAADANGANDGFHEVTHHRGGRRAASGGFRGGDNAFRGGERGRGRGGRGFRGERGGRGRGGGGGFFRGRGGRGD